MGYYLASGRVADVVVMPGIGEECLHPALALARREGVPIGGWLAPDAPPDTSFPAQATALSAASVRAAATRTVVGVDHHDIGRLDDLLADLIRTGLPCVTLNSAIPMGRLLPQQWIGYLGFCPDAAAATAVEGSRMLDSSQLATFPDAVRAASGTDSEWPSQRAGSAPRTATQEVVAHLDDVLPAESPVIADAGCAHRAVAQVIGHSGLRPALSTSGLTTMGWSLGAALGAWRANPGQRLAVVIGDGSLLIHLGAVATLARYRVPVVLLVLANGGFGSGHLRLDEADRERVFGLPDVDWKSALVSLGVRVETNLAVAVEACADGPVAVLAQVPRHDPLDFADVTGIDFLDASRA